MKDEICYIIVEDEYYARENLKRTIAALRPEWQLVFTSESVGDTKQFLESGQRCDLAFMDIELVDGNCFDTLSDIDFDIPVIFTTAYDKYAIKAFKVCSVDYLLKPVSESSAAEAIEKFERYFAHPVKPDYAELLSAINRLSGRGGRKRLLISRGNEYKFIETADIAYFFSEEKCVFAIDKNGRSHITEYSNLNNLENDVSRKDFFRCSRNTIVALAYITHIRKWFNGRLKVSVKNGDEQLSVTVSAARRDDFLKWLKGDF